MKLDQLQGRSFSVFLKTHTRRSGVRSTYFYHFKSDFIVWNGFGCASEFYIDHSASEVSKLVSWRRKKSYTCRERSREKTSATSWGEFFFSLNLEVLILRLLNDRYKTQRHIQISFKQYNLISNNKNKSIWLHLDACVFKKITESPTRLPLGGNFYFVHLKSFDTSLAEWSM